MLLQHLIKNLSFVGIKNYTNLDIDSLSNVSSEKNINGLYFCIKGGKKDGHDYAREAIDNGAVCLVVERYLDLPITQILVDNARLAMSIISANFYEFSQSKIKFIGLTGTNGKTTTTFIMREILKKLGYKVGVIGTEGIYIGDIKIPHNMTTPDPINLHKVIHDMDCNNIDYVVMEVSAHAIALSKVDSIMFDAVGLTNITQDHLDYFINMDNYALAKAKLVSSRHTKTAVVNIDDKYSKEIARNADIPVKTISLSKSANISVVNKSYDVNGNKAIIDINEKQYAIHTNLIGEYNLANALMAIGLCRELGFEDGAIIDALNNVKVVVPGRLNILNGGCHAVVDFAHTPDGMKNVLSTLNQIKSGRLIVVFGCGGNRDSSKRSQMGEVATKLADYVVITSDNPRFENPVQIIQDIEKGATGEYINIVNRKDAIRFALALAQPNDIVAILGKGAEEYIEVNGEKMPYSDIKVIKEYFNEQKKSVGPTLNESAEEGYCL